MRGVHRSRRNVSGSPSTSRLPRTSSPQAGPHRSPAAHFPRTHSKRKRPFDDGNNSLVLLANVGRKSKKKKPKGEWSGSAETSNWHISPVKNTSAENSESSDVDVNRSLSSMRDINTINKSSAEQSVDSGSWNLSKDLTNRDVDGIMRNAEFGDSDDSDNKFFQEQKYQFASNVVQPAPKSRRISDQNSNVIITPLYSKNCVVVLMNHPASISINDYVGIQVLSGCVSIYGYELRPRTTPIKIFSSRATGLVDIKTESYDHLWMRKDSFMNLSNHLHKVTGCLKIARKILKNCGSTTVVLFIEGSVFPRNLNFLELYNPEVLNFRLTLNFLQKVVGRPEMFHPHKRIYCLPSNENSVQFSPDAEDLASDIITAIRSAKLRDMPSPRILIFGPKNTGKSSLLRYLMNKILSLFPVVYYLDTDSGQTEFTPPGVVSLTEVKKPVIGPPFCHQRKPLYMSFTGGLSADMSPDMYSKSVSKLVYLFRQNRIREPLFINTMGWIKGLGLECLKNVMHTVSPTILIEMVTEEEDTMFDYRDYLVDKSQFYQICSPVSATRRSDQIPSQTARELSLLSYFSRCQPLSERVGYINSFNPICVSWDKIPVYVFGKKIVPFRMVEALNASIVALCRVDKRLVLESNIPDLPKTLEDEPDNECVGFGIVRAIDEVKHLMYIITPLTLEDMKGVNAIIKGNISLPESVILKQPLVGVPLPFTDMNESESDPESSDGQVYADVNRASTEYRRSIKRRHSRQRRKSNAN